MVTQMIAVGETDGAMDAMLQKIADSMKRKWTPAVTTADCSRTRHDRFLGVWSVAVVISMYLRCSR